MSFWGTKISSSRFNKCRLPYLRFWRLNHADNNSDLLGLCVAHSLLRLEYKARHLWVFRPDKDIDRMQSRASLIPRVKHLIKLNIEYYCCVSFDLSGDKTTDKTQRASERAAREREPAVSVKTTARMKKTWPLFCFLKLKVCVASRLVKVICCFKWENKLHFLVVFRRDPLMKF